MDDYLTNLLGLVEEKLLKLHSQLGEPQRARDATPRR